MSTFLAILGAIVLGYLTFVPVAFLLIAGWLFAFFNRDGITDPFEADNDRVSALGLAFFAAWMWPISVPLIYLATDRASSGWTLTARKP